MWCRRQKALAVRDNNQESLSMFDYKVPLDPHNLAGSAHEIVRLHRLLSSAHSNVADLLEDVVAETERADRAEAEAAAVNDDRESALVEAQRTIAGLKTERDALRVRMETAEATANSYKVLFEEARGALVVAQARIKKHEDRINSTKMANNEGGAQ